MGFSVADDLTSRGTATLSSPPSGVTDGTGGTSITQRAGLVTNETMSAAETATQAETAIEAGDGGDPIPTHTGFFTRDDLTSRNHLELSLSTAAGVIGGVEITSPTTLDFSQLISTFDGEFVTDATISIAIEDPHLIESFWAEIEVYDADCSASVEIEDVSLSGDTYAVELGIEWDCPDPPSDPDGELSVGMNPDSDREPGEDPTFHGSYVDEAETTSGETIEELEGGGGGGGEENLEEPASGGAGGGWEYVNPSVVRLGDACGVPQLDDQVTIDLTCFHDQRLDEMDIWLTYDPTVVEFAEITEPSWPGWFVGDPPKWPNVPKVVHHDADNGILGLEWAALAFEDYNLDPDDYSEYDIWDPSVRELSAQFAEITFNLVGGQGDATDLTLFETRTEMRDPDGTVHGPASLDHGSVSLQNGIGFGDASTEVGETFEVPIVMNTDRATAGMDITATFPDDVRLTGINGNVDTYVFDYAQAYDDDDSDRGHIRFGILNGDVDSWSTEETDPDGFKNATFSNLAGISGSIVGSLEFEAMSPTAPSPNRRLKDQPVVLYNTGFFLDDTGAEFSVDCDTEGTLYLSQNFSGDDPSDIEDSSEVPGYPLVFNRRIGVSGLRLDKLDYVDVIAESETNPIEKSVNWVKRIPLSADSNVGMVVLDVDVRLLEPEGGPDSQEFPIDYHLTVVPEWLGSYDTSGLFAGGLHVGDSYSAGNHGRSIVARRGEQLADQLRGGGPFQ